MRRWAIGAAVWMLLLVSCASPQAGSGTSPAASGAPGQEEGPPQRGGTLQFAASRPPAHLYYWTAQGIDASITLGPIYDPIIEYEFHPGEDWQIDHKLAPGLAQSWTIVDNKTYDFELRQGVHWHDGEELTADDIVFSYQTIVNPAKPTLAAGVLKDLDTVKALDRYHVRVTSKVPSAEFLALLASSSAQMKILPKHIADKGLNFEDTAVGTGPFKLQSYDRLTKTVLVRNDDYWREGPYVDKVVIAYGLDQAGRLAAFATRNNDLLTVGDQAQFETVKAAVPDVLSQVFPGNYNYGMYFNLREGPFSDIRVRKAMHLATDRTAMIDTLSFGQGLINPPAVAGAKKGWALSEDELKQLPGFRQPKDQDIAEAKRLLAEAGYPNGFKTSLTKNNGIITVGPVSEMLAGQMKAIGIDMTVKGEEPAVWAKSVSDGTYEVLMLNIGGMLPDRTMYTYLHSKGGLNSAPVKDPQLDKLIEAQSQELNVENRKQILRDLQTYLLGQYYHIPTIDLGFYIAWQPYVKHYVGNPGAQPYLVEPHSVWLDQKMLPPGR